MKDHENDNTSKIKEMAKAFDSQIQINIRFILISAICGFPWIKRTSGALDRSLVLKSSVQRIKRFYV
jgi:hypothetical protein